MCVCVCVCGVDFVLHFFEKRKGIVGENLGQPILGGATQVTPGWCFGLVWGFDPGREPKPPNKRDPNHQNTGELKHAVTRCVVAIGVRSLSVRLQMHKCGLINHLGPST